ncbi:hypothetical protein ACRALDRAFT_208581 [Sodiomyces alcalophilus JCM 7366]|uniref:uncharacterized protein n=1 Tax=Sodiomyces alcalophilus JCM 7366 TaxID=591952 RepID=UPI0039B3A9C8
MVLGRGVRPRPCEGRPSEEWTLSSGSFSVDGIAMILMSICLPVMAGPNANTEYAFACRKVAVGLKSAGQMSRVTYAVSLTEWHRLCTLDEAVAVPKVVVGEKADIIATAHKKPIERGLDEYRMTSN